MRIRVLCSTLSQGWLAKDAIPEIVVWTKFSFKTDELYGVVVRSTGEHSYSLSAVRWSFSVSNLKEICLDNIRKCEAFNNEKEKKQAPATKLLKRLNDTFRNLFLCKKF